MHSFHAEGHMIRPTLDRAESVGKWILATLAVLALLITCPIWGPFTFLWRFLGPMIVDMKDVIDGKMKFW